MDQTDPVREKVAYQLGFQVIALCEMTAKLEAQAQQLDAVTKERDLLKAEKAGASDA